MASPPRVPESGQKQQSSTEQSTETSAQSSSNHSRSGSLANPARPPREKQRVRWGAGESLDINNQRFALDIRDENGPSRIIQPANPKPRPSPYTTHGRHGSSSSGYPFPNVPYANDTQDLADFSAGPSTSGLRPLLMRMPPSTDSFGSSYPETKDVTEAQIKESSQRVAQERAQQLSKSILEARNDQSLQPRNTSTPVSNRGSPLKSPPGSPPSDSSDISLEINSIPLKKLKTRRKYGIEDDTDEEEENDNHPPKKSGFFRSVADKFMKSRGLSDTPSLYRVQARELESGQTTPIEDRDPNEYVPRPKQYRAGILTTLMKFYDEQGIGSVLGISNHPLLNRNPGAASSREALPGMPLGLLRADLTDTPPSSGATTPQRKRQKWYYKNPQASSTGSIASLINSSSILAQPGGSGAAPKARPGLGHRSRSSDALVSMLGLKNKGKGPKVEESIHIRVHIAEIESRQKYLLKLCRALMNYGAPTHRLEEYMRMSARVLEIEGQFLYIPGCMIVSFDDSTSHTTEVKIVRTAQAVDLGKLRDTHEIYKEVVHDVITLEEAMTRLDEVVNRKPKFGIWTLVLAYGCASATVGPFAFGARLIDLPLAFLLGSLLGMMQLVLCPKSELYANMFEISAAVITSFAARAFGSIKNGNVFCFSALAQSSIALILPGYIVLCGSLELQSRNIVAGSVRMVYAIIYSLFLGFGITIGTSIFGAMDKNATSAVTCQKPMGQFYTFLFVPPFTFCLIVINQGKWKQMPVMIIIAFIGFLVNHFSALRFVGNAQIANTLGALVIGVLGNSYSRLRHGLAAAALLPAIFVQVPSGLAASGSLVSGVTSANQITNQATKGTVSNVTTVSNATQAGLLGIEGINTAVFNVGYSMIQVAIGITVGLFLSALVVYPFGKKRSGLFSF